MLPLSVLALASLAFGLALGITVGAMATHSPGGSWSSRKVFHVGIFTGAVPAQLLQGFWGVVVYGAVIGTLVLLSAWPGKANPIHAALVRPEPPNGASGEDIITPLFSTALGGLVSVLFFGRFAVVGYLVCGWGDAAGEIVGRRWGTRGYGRPRSGSEGDLRTIEGSLGVFLAGWLAGGFALVLLGFGITLASGIGLVCGVVGAVSEGISGRGTDNFWVQVLPALAAWWFLG